MQLLYRYISYRFIKATEQCFSNTGYFSLFGDLHIYIFSIKHKLLAIKTKTVAVVQPFVSFFAYYWPELFQSKFFKQFLCADLELLLK